MKIERRAAFAPQTKALAAEMTTLNGPCLGCAGCDGLCAALVEAITLPRAVLKESRA